MAKTSGAEKWIREELCSAISNGDFFALLFFCLPPGCPPEAERPRWDIQLLLREAYRELFGAV